MSSASLAAKETDPHDIFVIEPDVVLAARADHATSRPAPDAVRPAPTPQATTVSDVLAGVSAPPADATFRVTADDAIKVLGSSPAAGRVGRAVIGFLLVLASLLAVAGWKQYGDTARAMVANWMPTLALTSSSPQQKPVESNQPGSPVLQAAATDGATGQPAPAPAVPPPVAAPPPPESAQLLQAMSQQIEELKASIEALKAGQAQLTRDMAKTSDNRTTENRAAETRTVPARAAEPAPRPKLAALPPPRPAATPVRRPRPAFAPMQAGVASPLPPPAPAPVMLPPPAPPLPPEDTAQSEFGPVIRPPMPLR
jgi:hypothetical protein